MFEIYSKPACTNCDQAKALLQSKGLDFVEHQLDVGQVKDASVKYFTVDQLQQLVPGARTVPQIFQKTGDEAVLIGGWEALKRHLA
jgi:glutaredoxin